MLESFPSTTGSTARTREAGIEIPSLHAEQNLFLKCALPSWKPGVQRIVVPCSAAPQQPLQEDSSACWSKGRYEPVGRHAVGTTAEDILSGCTLRLGRPGGNHGQGAARDGSEDTSEMRQVDIVLDNRLVRARAMQFDVVCIQILTWWDCMLGFLPIFGLMYFARELPKWSSLSINCDV